VKRSRRGGRRPQGGTNGHNNSGGNTFNPNRVYDSSGPEVKIRGTASHVYEKYLQLARDANASGDRVMAENYLQHAEHYFRILAAMQAQQAAQAEAKMAAQAAAQPTSQPQQASVPQPEMDEDMDDEEEMSAPVPVPAPAPAPARPQRRTRRSSAPASAPATVPGGVGEQPSLGDDAGPSFSLNEASSANEDAQGSKVKAPAGE